MLAKAFKVQPEFLPKQVQAFNYTFYQETETTAAERGARAIAEFLRKKLRR
jgi:hypothetical protein